MADIFTGTVAPNVTTTKETAVVAPQYLTDYLTTLAKTGTSSLGNTVAPLSSLQTGAMTAAPTDLNSYKTAMDSALAAGQAGSNVSQSDISKFYNPFESQVVDQMATDSAVNAQRNLLPQMKAGFVGSGGLGSQRYANATGQTMSDISRDLLAQQTKTRMSGYQSALDAALKEQGQQTTAATALGNVGAQTETAAQGSLKSMSDLGAIEQAQNQAVINAPMTNATNAAALLRGYTYPTTTTETYKGPAQSYGASPLAQIAGLGTLLGSGFNGSGGWGSKLFDAVGKYMSTNSTNSFGTTSTSDQSTGENPMLGPDGKPGHWDDTGNWVTN